MCSDNRILALGYDHPYYIAIFSEKGELLEKLSFESEANPMLLSGDNCELIFSVEGRHWNPTVMKAFVWKQKADGKY